MRVVRCRHRKLPQLSCDTCDENNGFFKTADKCGGEYYSVVLTSFGATKYLSTKVLYCVLNMHRRLPQLSCDTFDENNGFFKIADKCGGEYYSVVSTSFGATKYLSNKVLKYQST